MPLPAIKRKPAVSDSSQQDLDRPTAGQIYEQVTINGRRALDPANL